MVKNLKNIFTNLNIDIKHIAIAFGLLIALQFVLVYSFDNAINQAKEELSDKREVLSKLKQLERKWSKSVQKDDLEQLYKLLDLFEVTYTLEEKKNKKTLSMELKQHNADKVLGLLVNKSIQVKKLSVKKVDAFTIKLMVDII